MSPLDWVVVGSYLFGLFVLALWCARKQESGDDYYLAGRDLSALSLATSTIATQCSTNSLLGAPAFVGFVAGGGMIWLQYELAVPLAMLALAYLLLPMRRTNQVSIYGFLEDRLGRSSRLLASGCFLVFRGVATGVTVYGVAIVLELLLGVSYTSAVLLLMVVTISYDLLGGLRAVVISDVVQTILIVLSIFVGLGFLMLDAGHVDLFARERADTIHLDWGVSGGDHYGLWPMLFGGFFLYCAYYGCDQSQTQRVLATSSPQQTGRVLLFNGLLRFPLVLLYCLLGLALASYAARYPGFLASLPLTNDGSPNLNLVFPAYVIQQFPIGLVGLVMVGIFAAAMSSIDSALNSLSAATVEDFWFGGSRAGRPEQRLVAGRIATIGWGVFVLVFSYQVETIAPTVLEAINKIGSFANGPLLALFTIALLCPQVGERCAILAFACGLFVNCAVSYFLPGVSWLWWNLIGFGVAMGLACACGGYRDLSRVSDSLSEPIANQIRPWLLGGFGLIAIVCLWIDRLSTN